MVVIGKVLRTEISLHWRRYLILIEACHPPHVSNCCLDVAVTLAVKGRGAGYLYLHKLVIECILQTLSSPNRFREDTLPVASPLHAILLLPRRGSGAILSFLGRFKQVDVH